mgnify:CR=1 FL=1
MQDSCMLQIIEEYGYPLIFSRPANFETLIHIILEQQVSLASAKAALVQLKQKIGEVTAEKILLLTDQELRGCYFSKQKISYAKCLAEEVINGSLVIDELYKKSDEEVSIQLKKIKGIGNWTVDVFLMMALHRCNCFPTGDIALINSIKHVKQLPKETSKEEILQIAEQWQPYRTIAAYILWWAYIKRKNIKWG